MRRFLFRLFVLVALVAAPATVLADTEGQSAEFFTEADYDVSGADRIDATLRVVGERAYFYVDDRYWAVLTTPQRATYLEKLRELADEFDDIIRPKSVALWGSEASPGVDGDVRVTVVLERLISSGGGYFQTVHSHPASVEGSNAREMVFVSADSVNTGLARDFLAHEYQHLISYNQKELSRRVADDLWLNEGRSEYSVTHAGYAEPYAGSALQRRVNTFLRTPSDSLVAWPNASTDYGIVSVFVHYLTDRYGPDILASTLRTDARGIAALDEWLAANGKTERFPEVFADWMAAALVNDSNDPRYGYRTPGIDAMRVVPGQAAALSRTSQRLWDLRLQEWQPTWIRMDIPQSGALPPAVTIRVSGQGGGYVGTYVADYAGDESIFPWRAPADETTVTVPTELAGRQLRNITFTLAHGSPDAGDDREIETRQVSVAAALDSSVIAITPVTTVAPAPETPLSAALRDGDLIRRAGQQEVYVVWGKYRRHLTPGVLALYGFQDRPVVPVSDEVFFRYSSSNYIRAEGTEPVYAVWPDGTKHWFNISAAQWDASGRDWGAVFIVNQAEAAFYASGADIRQ